MLTGVPEVRFVPGVIFSSIAHLRTTSFGWGQWGLIDTPVRPPAPHLTSEDTAA